MKQTTEGRKIILPELTQYQKRVWEWLGCDNHTGKVAVVKSVRQSGKSFFAILKLIEYGFTFKKTTSAIYEPTLAQSRRMYKLFVKAFEKSGLIKYANTQTLEIELANGSEILFKSTEQDSRSFTLSGLLILDECAFLEDDAIYTILPLRQAYNSPMICISTPFCTEGFYYSMYCMGLTGEDDKIRTFDWAGEKEIELFLTEEMRSFYKKTMSKQKYKTEVDGEFLTDDGLLFTNISNCINTRPNTPTYLYGGIDWGTGANADSTVFTLINEIGQEYKTYSSNNLTPTQQIEWIFSIINDLEEQGFIIRKINAEENSIGKIYIDMLDNKISDAKFSFKITRFITTNSSKQDIVTGLQLALEQQKINILGEAEQLNQIKKYTAEINAKTKTITYNGHGAHDDRVIALMLAWDAFVQSAAPTYSVRIQRKTRKQNLREKYK